MQYRKGSLKEKIIYHLPRFKLFLQNLERETIFTALTFSITPPVDKQTNSRTLSTSHVCTPAGFANHSNTNYSAFSPTDIAKLHALGKSPNNHHVINLKLQQLHKQHFQPSALSLKLAEMVEKSHITARTTHNYQHSINPLSMDELVYKEITITITAFIQSLMHNATDIPEEIKPNNFNAFLSDLCHETNITQEEIKNNDAQCIGHLNQKTLILGNDIKPTPLTKHKKPLLKNRLVETYRDADSYVDFLLTCVETITAQKLFLIDVIIGIPSPHPDDKTLTAAHNRHLNIQNLKKQPGYNKQYNYLYQKDFKALNRQELRAITQTLTINAISNHYKLSFGDIIAHCNNHNVSTPFSSYKPNTPNVVEIQTQKPETITNNYIIYCAFDINGTLRYIGEGRPDRPDHINSGASHNRKLNEHFFKHGPMSITLLATDLTKHEAKTTEYALIQEFGETLWNKADNQHHTQNPKVHWETYSTTNESPLNKRIKSLTGLILKHHTPIQQSA